MKTTLHREYRTWDNMKGRCLNPNHRLYKWYGARGITIYEEWINNPTAFLTYLDDTLGPRPHKYELDRIDNDKGYEPGNLRWATSSQQKLNARNPDKSHMIGVEIGGNPNSLGYKWVRQQRNGRFQGQFGLGGKKVTCGTFDTACQAYEAVCNTRREMGLQRIATKPTQGGGGAL